MTRTPRASMWSICVAAAVALACFACTLSDSGATPTSDGGSEASTAAWGGSACATCIDTSCAQEIQACGGEPSCAAHLTCLRACAPAQSGDVDPTCESTCPAGAGSVGQSLVAGLDACRHSGAGATCTACGGAAVDAGDGGDAGCAHPLLCQQCGGSTETAPCPICEDQNCCETYADCHNDAACQAYATCMKSECTLGDLAQCVAFCDGAHPGGYAKFAVRLACMRVRCLDQCSGPSPCVECQTAHCAKQYMDCQTNEACSRAALCFGNCAGSQQCGTDCITQNPGSEPALDEYTTCALTYCTDACN